MQLIQQHAGEKRQLGKEWEKYVAILFLAELETGRETRRSAPTGWRMAGLLMVSMKENLSFLSVFYELLDLKYGFSPELIAILASLNSNNMWVFPVRTQVLLTLPLITVSSPKKNRLISSGPLQHSAAEPSLSLLSLIQSSGCFVPELINADHHRGMINELIINAEGTSSAPQRETEAAQTDNTHTY